MNKLSIFLSMIVAVAVAAIAATGVAGSSLLDSRATTQGYWFTLSRTMEGSLEDPTAGAKGEIRYMTIGGAAVEKYEPSTQTGALADNFFWHAEKAPDEKGGYYLRNNVTGQYLSPQIYQAEKGSEVAWGYRVISVSSESAAGTWNIFGNDFNSANPIVKGEITVQYAPAIKTVPEGTTITANTYLAMSDHIFGRLWLVTAAGDTFDESGTDIGTLHTEWDLKTAESYYDEAVTAGADKIDQLIAVSTLWDNTAAVEAAKKAIDDVKGQYNFPTSYNSNITGVIKGVTDKLDAAYNKLYASINSQVVTLANGGSFLAISDGTLDETSAVADIYTYWTIGKSGNGYTFKNDFLNQYLAFIPAKDEIKNEIGVIVSEAVPAHFGLSSRASVFTLVPDGSAIVLEYPDYTFGVAPDAAHNVKTSYTISPVTSEDAKAAVETIVDDNRQQAVDFLGAVSAMATNGWQSADSWPEGNIFNHYAEVANKYVTKLSDPSKVGASTILSEARSQIQAIINIVNQASTPMFLSAGAAYVSAARLPYEGYSLSGAEVTYQIPQVNFVTPGATAITQRLSTALWAFEYVGNGRARFFNTEELYLTAPHYEKQLGQLTNATEDPASATTFTISGGQFQYDDNGTPATLALKDAAGTEQSVFAISNAMTTPEVSDYALDTDLVPIPDDNARFYRIASVGGGGMIGAIMPGDHLTHSASSIGSYWWFEKDRTSTDPKAYLIHSVFPGYYLGKDLTLSQEPFTWYIGENSATHATNISQVFNGYESGLLISANQSFSSVIAAQPYTSEGNPNPGLTTGRFSTSTWGLTSWMFVEATDIANIVSEYVEALGWQKMALTEALEQIASELPFTNNSLSAAVGEISLFNPAIGGSISESLDQVLEFNNILAAYQTIFDEEVIEKAPGRRVKIINTGRQSDMSSYAYLAGSGASLKLVDILDTNADSEWIIKANGNKGITFTNGEGRTLGAPQANGSLSYSTGTYRLSLDIWWHTFDKDGNETGVSPWYSVPAEVTASAADPTETDAYRRSLNFGIGLENVFVPCTGLAATPGKNGKICGSDLISPYAQWRLVTYNPAPNGIDGIEGDAEAAQEVELFNLQGIRVNRADAAPGIYISRRADGSVVKVIIR